MKRRKVRKSDAPKSHRFLKWIVIALCVTPNMIVGATNQVNPKGTTNILVSITAMVK
jgi:hypothetical protein